MTNRRTIDPEDPRLTAWETHVLRTIALRLWSSDGRSVDDRKAWSKLRGQVQGPRSGNDGAS